MALYRTISMSFWTDSKVVDDFTPEDRYFYLYLFTNPHTNLCGCYEISIRQMANELGYAKESVENLIKRFEAVHNVIRYSSVSKEILLLNWYKYNWTKSEKFRVPLNKEIEQVKDESFKQYLCNKADIPYPYGIDTNCIDITNTYTNTITNTITNTVSNTKSDSKAKRFVPPELSEVQEYCRERGNNIDAEQFIAYYDTRDWMVSGRKMKSWKSAIVTWEKNGYSNKRGSYIDRIDNRVNVVDSWVEQMKKEGVQ